LVELVGLGVFGEYLAIRHRIAQREVVRAHGAVGRLDRAVPDLLPAREFGSGQKPRIVQVAHAEEPFLYAFGAYAESDELERTGEALVLARGLHVGLGRYIKRFR